MMILKSERTAIQINEDFSLSVRDRAGKMLWQSCQQMPPATTVRLSDGHTLRFPLSNARDRKTTGNTIRLSGFSGTDIVLELSFTVDAAADELNVEVAQAGGNDTVTGIDHFYRFQKPVSEGGYLVLPHGSGYLIAADSADALPGGRDQSYNYLIGGRWTLPMFGMVKNGQGMCLIVDTWWDCEVREEHLPGKYSALNMKWVGSLGRLAYPRRFILRFGPGMDYVAMAKIYRRMAAKSGLLRTLAEKAKRTPVIEKYIENVLLRQVGWDTGKNEEALADIRRFKETEIGVNFFFPKLSAQGYSPETGKVKCPDAGWQAYLLPDPVPGGWPVLKQYEQAVHELGCTVQLMLTMRWHYPDAPAYDAARWSLDASGNRVIIPNYDGFLGTHDALQRLKMALDRLRENTLKGDVLYFDGYSAAEPIHEDYAADHPMTRRNNFEMQNACFIETRRQGIMPGAELARFWCVGECDYFFYTDWSCDRLYNTGNQITTAPAGKPIPLFQLVFHDCYMAGFAGGGYAVYLKGVDWWENRTPRLYELLFAAAPAYNWLPEGYVPITDWGKDIMDKRLSWLKKWKSYSRAIAKSEMTTHTFLSADYSRQRVEFANGVVAEFDMAANRFRIIGVPEFSGNWESPEDL